MGKPTEVVDSGPQARTILVTLSRPAAIDGKIQKWSCVATDKKTGKFITSATRVSPYAALLATTEKIHELFPDMRTYVLWRDPLQSMVHKARAADLPRCNAQAFAVGLAQVVP